METLTLASTTITAAPTLCTTTLLPAHGLLTMSNAPSSVVLASAVVYQVPCPTAKPVSALAVISAEDAAGAKADPRDSSSDTRFSDFRDPFYASTFPICYALAATTVTAYMLLIMLFITPRSFLDGGVVYLGRRRGFTHSAGGESIGGRPWLQKVAALTVAVSLTIATHDTFKVAQRQYQWGAQNAGVLQIAVMGSMELRVIRLISNTFLWLAQAQTLIRLFPRHREKVIIKWAAFALITLDLIFSALNSFKDRDRALYPNAMGGSFDHPVPALSYLFQLLLGVLYAAWVIYYSLMKKRYAFYHPLMKNMPLLAMISLVSILIPVVFFIMDISKPEFTGWGDYVRWVGAAAASVIVWEWVERIEALEREEKKDGILGREVFDGDETLEVNASEFPWLRHRKHRKDDGAGGADRSSGLEGGGGGGGGAHPRDLCALRANGWHGVSAITGRQRAQARDAHAADEQHTPRIMGDILRPARWPSRPAPAVTPVSRTDTPSAASTVYAVRYQGTSDSNSRTPDPPPPLPHAADVLRRNGPSRSSWRRGGDRGGDDDDNDDDDDDDDDDECGDDDYGPAANQALAAAAAPDEDGALSLPRRSTDLEAAVDAASPEPTSPWRTLSLGKNAMSEKEEGEAEARMKATPVTSEPRTRDEAGRWDIRSRLELFAANQAEKLREKLRPTADTESLPVTRIPAPPRRGAALQQVLEEEEESGGAGRGGRQGNRAASRGGRFRAEEGPPRGRRHDGAAAGAAGGNEGGAANPPLWPGVRRRALTFDVDDGSSYDDSLTVTASLESEGRESQDEGGTAASARQG